MSINDYYWRLLLCNLFTDFGKGFIISCRVFQDIFLVAFLPLTNEFASNSDNIVSESTEKKVTLTAQAAGVSPDLFSSPKAPSSCDCAPCREVQSQARAAACP